MPLGCADGFDTRHRAMADRLEHGEALPDEFLNVSCIAA